MPNVFKSPHINISDNVNINQRVFLLDSQNDTGITLFVIYIYRLPDFQTHGFKVGMTICHDEEIFWDAIRKRINKQQQELALSDDQYVKYGNDREVVYWGVCLDARNASFKDYYVHERIKSMYVGLIEQNQEWFNGLPLDDLIDAFDSCRMKGETREIYTPRKEQRECIDALSTYFKANSTGKRFLLNCKMRFGKCFTTYKYCEENDIDKILVLTFVPAVQKSWQEDLYHITKEYDYFTDENLKNDLFDLNKKNKPYVLFLSLQNYLGKDAESKTTKDKIKKLQGIDFDMVVLDEYHFGAWNDRTQETILEDFDPDYAKAIKKGVAEEDIIKKFEINTKKTICLSGTPFKALARGEFGKDNTFTYTYFDEQKNKYPEHDEEDYRKTINPDYAMFPDMKIFGYNMSVLFKGLSGTVFSDDKLLGKKYFSLNKFFETNKDSNIKFDDEFVYEEQIKEWLEIIKGRSTHGGEFPYSNTKMLQNNKHTLWLMPTILSCAAMEKLFKNDEYFSKYEIINLSQPNVGAGKKALDYLNLGIKRAENTNKLGSIAITVNKLTLGVTIKPWMSVFVLKDLASPESYFQSIFRIQTPYVVEGQVLKEDGYVYDFNIDRAAALLLKFAEQSQDQSTTKMQIAKLIVKYMPIFINGDMSAPIGYDVFYDLAMYGDSRGIPLSRRIRDIDKTTRMLDEEVVANMMNDPEVSEIIKRVFAHTKFNKLKTKTRPDEPPTGFNSEAGIKGQAEGHAQGIIDSDDYIDFDDEIIQKEYDSRLKEHLDKRTPKEYDEINQNYYKNGFIKGYESGVNAPIKKLKCGKDDGKKFAEALKKERGEEFFYEGANKVFIDNTVKAYLNKDENIPDEYSKMLYKRWYKSSFLQSARNSLRKPRAIGDNESVESAENVIQHLISRLFQFLYISVYRETTFDEIFKNANPEVFLEAVGITKKDFETLNRYNVFQEDVLNNYIHEFFVNESLGSSLNMDDEIVKKNYRNSFQWFGHSDVTAEEIQKDIESYIQEINEHEKEKSVIETTTDTSKDVKEQKQTTSTEDETKVKAYDKRFVVPEINVQMNHMEKKVFNAVWIICALENEIGCRPYLKTIKNYLLGNSSSIFYPYFNGMPYCGSVSYINNLKIENAIKSLVDRGIFKYVKEKKDSFYPSEKL
jgi:hypothetical protein